MRLLHTLMILITGLFLLISVKSAAQSLFEDLLTEPTTNSAIGIEQISDLEFDLDFCRLFSGKILRARRNDGGVPYDLYVPSEKNCFNSDWITVWDCVDTEDGCDDRYYIKDVELMKIDYQKNTNSLCFGDSYILDFVRPYSKDVSCYKTQSISESNFTIYSPERGQRIYEITPNPLVRTALLQNISIPSTYSLRSQIKNHTFTLNRRAWEYSYPDDIEPFESGDIARIEQIFFGEEFAWAKVVAGSTTFYSSYVYSFQYGADGQYELCLEQAPGTYFDVVGCYMISLSNVTLRKALVRQEDADLEVATNLYDETFGFYWNKGRTGDVYGLNQKFDDQEASDFWEGMLDIIGGTAPIWMPLLFGG